MEWFGFWIFMSVVIIADAWLYSKGHDGLFFVHKTDAEKKLQDAMIQKLQRETN